MTRTLMKEMAFIGILVVGIIAIAHAQDAPNQKKVKVQIEVTEDGKTSTSTQEIQLGEENYEDRLEEMIEEIEMVLEEAVEDIEESDLEIIINKRDPAGESLFAPYYRNRIRQGRGRGHHPHAPDRLFEKMEMNDRPFLGVVSEGIDEEEADELKIEGGARLHKIVEGSGAEEAGLLVDDIVLEIGGMEVSSHHEVSDAIRANKIGDEVEIKYLRAGKKGKTNATLGSYKLNSEFGLNRDDQRAFYDIFLGPEEPHRPGKGFAWKDDMDDRKVFLGIEGKTEDEDGVTITKIFENSTAEAIGLEEGDVLRKLNESEIEDIGQLIALLKEMEVGQEVSVTFDRDGETRSEQGKLQAFPDDLRKKFTSKNTFHFDDADVDQKFVFRFEMEEMDPDEIEELSKKSGNELDVTNSLDMEDFMIYPNPSDGVFILSGMPSEAGTAEVLVLDQSGKEVQSRSLSIGEDGVLTRIDLTNEPSGIYFISIQQNGKGKVNRVVKQ